MEPIEIGLPISCQHEGDVCEQTFKLRRSVSECTSEKTARNSKIDAEIARLQALNVQAEIAALEAAKA